ncbi:MAG: ABC transporter permease [Gemmataceae bacterium]|nr:ABC transporter permease [Gemmataceae bacterium]
MLLLFLALFLPMALFIAIVLLGATVLVPLALAASVIAVVIAFSPVLKVPTKYLVRNLQVRWWIPLITSLSVALVIFLTTWMFAIVQGMYRLTGGTGHPANIMILADGATDEAFSSLPGGFSVELLDSELRKFIAKGPSGKYMVAKEVYVIVTHQLPNAVEGGRQRRFVQMRGLEDPEVAAEVHGIELAKGRWFSQTGVPEIVLGDGVARTFGQDMGKEALEPGDEVKIGKLTWKVVGVMSAINATFASEIWVLDKVVQNNFGRENSYSSYVARTVQLVPSKKQNPTSTIEARLASKLLKETRAEGRAFSAQPEREYYAKLTQTNQQFLYAYLFIAAVIAIGGVLGVMITMFAAVSQRAKDIGVLRLLGFRRWQILLAFLFESLVIALLGGLIGLTLGYLVFNGQTLSSIVSSGQGGGKSVVLRLEVDRVIALIDISFALLMGAVGGFVPAFNAMRLRPLESLR